MNILEYFRDFLILLESFENFSILANFGDLLESYSLVIYLQFVSAASVNRQFFRSAQSSLVSVGLLKSLEFLSNFFKKSWCTLVGLGLESLGVP